MPEHEAAFDDGDVEYTFTVTDPVSGIPEPEDLADDTNGDARLHACWWRLSAMQPVPFLRTRTTRQYSKVSAEKTAGNDRVVQERACRFGQVVDDRDFDEIDDGFEVSIRRSYLMRTTSPVRNVSSCATTQATARCTRRTQNDTDEALAQITIDTSGSEVLCRGENRHQVGRHTDEELDDNN